VYHQGPPLAAQPERDEERPETEQVEQHERYSGAHDPALVGQHGLRGNRFGNGVVGKEHIVCGPVRGQGDQDQHTERQQQDADDLTLSVDRKKG
jgi:hypothetical protein